MNGIITCSVKEASELMKHLNEDDMITLTIMNKKTMTHKESKRIKKGSGEDLINKADSIEYQDNDFFGRLSLFGVLKDKDVIHNILFQLHRFHFQNI